MKIHFRKMVGTGNDFIVIDNREKTFPEQDKALIVKLCARRYGIGSDGVILLERSDKADFRMRIINPDGSEVEMCGNGSRCAVRMARDLGLFKGSSASFETIAGLLKAEIHGSLVRLDMGLAKGLKKNLPIMLDGEQWTLHFINTGVPHAVMIVKDVSAVDVFNWGRAIRNSELFKPAGTNANFLQVVDKKTIKVRTYERGVEDETFSCGTGTCASAIIAGVIEGAEKSIKSITAKNENLFVDYETNEKGLPGRFYLSGPADYVYEGSVEY